MIVSKHFEWDTDYENGCGTMNNVLQTSSFVSKINCTVARCKYHTIHIYT